MTVAPDIIKIKERKYDEEKITSSYWSDLSVNSLVSALGGNRRGYIESAFANYSSDPAIIKYRQAIIKDILENEKFIKSTEQLEGVVSKLRSERQVLIDSYRNVLDYDKLVEIACSLTDAYTKFSQTLTDFSFVSEGLQDLQKYLTNITQDPLLMWYVQALKDGITATSSLEILVHAETQHSGISAVTVLSHQEKFVQEGNYKNKQIAGHGTDKELLVRLLDKAATTNLHAYTGTLMDATANGLAQLQFYFKIVDFMKKVKTLHIPMCFPEILPMVERKIEVVDAHSPFFIARKLHRTYDQPDLSKLHIVANDIFSDADHNFFLLTGPNNGGKTRYMETIGLIYLMAMAGMPVPAKSAKVSPVDNIFTHFVTADNKLEDEGRYKYEQNRVRNIVELATPYSLLLVDEPCGGSSHEEGVLQSCDLNEVFHFLGGTTYFSTHLHPVAGYLESQKHRLTAAANKQVLITVNPNGKLKYLYKIGDGAAGKSYGREIAESVGATKTQLLDAIQKRVRKGTIDKSLLRYESLQGGEFMVETKEYMAFIGRYTGQERAEEIPGVVSVENGLGLPFPKSSVLGEIPEGGIADVYFVLLDGNKIQKALGHAIRELRLDEFIMNADGNIYVTTVLPTPMMTSQGITALKKDPLCKGIYQVSGFRSQPDLQYRQDGLVVTLQANSKQEAYSTVRSAFSDVERVSIFERIAV